LVLASGGVCVGLVVLLNAGVLLMAQLVVVLLLVLFGIVPEAGIVTREAGVVLLFVWYSY